MTVPDFQTLFQRELDFVWRVLARHGVAEADLPDVCQQVFLVVHRQLERFEGRASVRTWLYAICRRVAANHRARAAQRYEVLGREDPPKPAEAREVDADGEGFSEVARRQALQRLHALLAQLPEAQREVFVLYEIEELNLREIAEALRIPRGTVFARLEAARRSLEAKLARERAQRRVG